MSDVGFKRQADGGRRLRRWQRLAAWCGFSVVLAACVPAISAGPPKGHAVARPGTVLTPIAVFGADDRSNLPSHLDTVAERIGLLFNNQARTVCTAFCVAENMIATAAHCIARGQNGPAVRYSDFTFARDYDRRQDFSRIEGASAGAAAQNILAGDFKLRVRPPIDAANDWAIVKLQRKGCPAGALPVRSLPVEELIEIAKAKRLFQVSYHRDWAQWRPAYSKPCAASRDFEMAKWPSISPDFMMPDSMVLHTCDTGGASSGSPLLIESEDGPVVVAINVGTYVQSRIQTENGQVTTRQRAETIANTAVAAHAFLPAIDALRRAQILGSGGPMRELQERLASRGFYKSRIDGAYGATLKSAIEAFEQANRLPVTGLATQTLLARLQQDEPPRSEVTPSLATQPPR